MCEEDIDELREQLNGVQTVAQTALQRVAELEEEIHERDEKIKRLEFRIGELEVNADPDPESKPYKELEPEEKTAVLQKALIRRAEATNGKASYYYGDVMSLFNDYPSPSTAYRIMRRAGNTAGFEFVEDPSGDDDKHLRVNLAEVTDESLVSPGNNAGEEVEV